MLVQGCTVENQANLSPSYLAAMKARYGNGWLARQICCRLFAEFPSFTPDRQMALLSMAFNLGAPRLAKFHNMRRAIARLILAVRGKSGRFGQCVK